MKILVLENVENLPGGLNCYLKENHANDEIEIINNISFRMEDNPDEIKDELTKAFFRCDKIVFESTFKEDSSSIAFMIALAIECKVKSVDFIASLHTAGTEEVMNQLNLKLGRGNFSLFKELLRSDCVVRNIEEYKYNVTEDGAYFFKFEYHFVATELIYKEEACCVWWKTRPVRFFRNEKIFKMK